MLIITKEGRTISGVMSFYFRDEVLPYYGGGTAEARDVAGKRLHVLGIDAARLRTGIQDLRFWPQQAEHRLFRF